ncbi:hypothetical protein P5V15_004548 [Pogonomyrmex californicus]
MIHKLSRIKRYIVKIYYVIFLLKIFLKTSFNKNITDRSLKEILDLLSELGDLYIANFDRDSSNDMELDQLLMKYYKGSYNIIEIMKNLSPNCSAMLLKCKLHGTSRNCSTLFEFRRTQDGYCCVFNYMRESDDIPIIDLSDIITETNYMHKVTDLGIDRGLTVVMEPFVEDYFYSIMPIQGWKIIVFNPTDYPDMTSGGVTEVFAMPLTETYIDVTPTVFFSTNIIKGFTKEKRNCLFETETDTQFNGAIYTYSDCIVNCKIQHIQKICGCRPFIYPRRGIEENSWRICTTLDLHCLAKHKSLWMTIYPHESLEDIYIKEKALHCHNCYPACDDVKYEVLSWKSYMSAGGYNTNLLWDFNVTDQGILHVFFSKYGTIRLKQDVASYWYDLMSDIGGICGVFIGFSFITAVELLYFFALMFRDLIYKKSVLDEDDRKDEIPSVQTQTAQTIYWNELVPRSWRSAKYGKFSVNKARY